MLNLVLPAAIRLKRLAVRLLRHDRRGIETLEWAVVAAVVIVAAVGAYNLVEDGVSASFSNLSSSLSGAGTVCLQPAPTNGVPSGPC